MGFSNKMKMKNKKTKILVMNMQWQAVMCIGP